MTLSPSLRGRPARRLALGLGLAGALVLLWASRPFSAAPAFGSAGTHDFVQYWAAARLAARGADPYDPAAMLAEQQGVGWAEPQPLPLWNPPWTLALLLPLAWLPFGPAALAWLLINLALLLVSGLLLWRTLAPGDGRYWLGLLAAATLAPGISALLWGQISPWLLAGVALFLWAEHRRSDTLAGAALALLLIKPQVALLFWLAALWVALRGRRWRLLLSWLAALAAACTLVALRAPAAFAGYLAALAAPPLEFYPPTLGTWLRLLLGPDRAWLQLLPAFLGVVALLFWLARRPPQAAASGAWRWDRLAAPLLLASALTAAYGWSYDYVVLLPAVVFSLGRAGRRLGVAALLVALLQVALLLQARLGLPDLLALWYPAFLAILLAWLGARAKDRTPAGPGALP